MQPNQPEAHHDPQRYDFFLNPPAAPKKSMLPKVPGSSDPFIQKIILLIGGGVIAVIVIAVLASVVFGGKNTTANLVQLAQQQNELIRVATEANSGAVQQTTKSLAVNTNLSLDSAQQQLITYLKAHGQSVSIKELALTKSSATDTQLTNATSASNFDPVFAKIIQQQLQTYATTLKQDFTTSSNAKLRTILSKDYIRANLLLDQANTTVSMLQQSP